MSEDKPKLVIDNASYLVQYRESGKVYTQVWIEGAAMQPDSFDYQLGKQNRILKKTLLKPGEEKLAISELLERYPK